MSPLPRIPGAEPQDRGEALFGAPWEARVFALAVQLSEGGLFTWEEWATAFAAEVAEAEAHGYEPERDYYRCWLRALEGLLAARGVLSAEGLHASIAHAEATWPHPPHGARREPVAVSPPGGA